MPTYKHNDYYGYINKVQQKGISDPQWFWSDSEDASKARQWLYNNGASAMDANGIGKGNKYNAFDVLRYKYTVPGGRNNRFLMQHPGLSNQVKALNTSVTLKPGGILKGQNGKSFENWYKIVPEDKNDTTSYNLRRAYELAPKEELEAFVTDPNAHLRSAYPTKEGNIEFVKSITHPSLLWELADYNSKPKFNKEWKLSVLKYPYLQYSK